MEWTSNGPRSNLESGLVPGGRSPPTGKRVEVPVIVVVQFRDGKIAGERIYWDQASVLAQVGLIDSEKLPATGSEASRKVVNPLRRNHPTG